MAIRQKHPDEYHHILDSWGSLIPEYTIVMRHWRFVYDAYLHGLPFPTSSWHDPLQMIVREPTDYKPRKPHTPAAATFFSSPRWFSPAWWAPRMDDNQAIVESLQAHSTYLDVNWCTKCAIPTHAARSVPVKPPSMEYLRVFYPYVSL
eukprot:jgi/Chlat1/7323/Chrsp58S06938